MPAGPNLCKIVPVGPKEIRGVPRIDFVFMPCFQCEEAWCMAACPTGAIARRIEEGIVTLDSKLCIGCKACITACPYGAAQWNPETSRAVKCDYCLDRLEEGLEPACVTGCTTEALKWISPARSSLSKREKFAHKVAKGRPK